MTTSTDFAAAGVHELGTWADLRLEVAILGERDSAEAWPPRYSRWTATET